WDLETGTEVIVLKGHTASVVGIKKLDEKQLVSGSYDNTIRIWNLETGKEIKQLVHAAKVLCIEKLNDRHLAVGDKYGDIRIWDLDTDTCIKLIKGSWEWRLQC